MTSPAKVVLLACGSFNPITNMHLRMFEIARDALHKTNQYKVIGGIISPVSDRYEKKELVQARHRCEMVRRSLKSSSWISLDTWESEQPDWSETAMVLRHQKAQLENKYRSNPTTSSHTPTKKRKRGSEDNDFSFSNVPTVNINETLQTPVQVKLLCGADLLESFAVPGLWKEEDIEEIVSQYGLACISRAGSDAGKFIYETDVLHQHQNNILMVTEWIQNDVSATKVRRSLRRGESVKYLLQDSVIDYIMEHQLYDVPDNKYMDQMTRSPSVEPATNEILPKQQSLPDVLDSPPGSPSKLRKRNSSEPQKSFTPPITPVKPPRQISSMNSLTDINTIMRRMKNVRVAFPETCV